MEDRWNQASTRCLESALDECVYGSRLIGSDPDLVLHGGGNTSIKTPFTDVTGDSFDALFVKGSGWDLATIERRGFAPLNLSRLRDLLALDSLSDTDMMRELKASSFDPDAPAPSVESLLHAYIPHQAVQHSHADAIVSITNVVDGETCVREVFGDSVVVIPYVMPGFDLAKAVAVRWPDEAHDHTVGMVLLNHGLFTFGETTAEAYARHHQLISKAERWLDEHAPLPAPTSAALPKVDRLVLSDLRRRISESANRPMVLCRHSDPVSTRFVQRIDLESIATRGPLTPDHVIRTRRVPMVGRDVESYGRAYAEYFDKHEHRGRTGLTMLDAAPRIVVDVDLGVLTAGRTVGEADIAFDIYEHTMPALERAEDHLGGYVALEPEHIFDVEYWDLEQAKLHLAGPPPALAGNIAIVTGAASGIGRACAAELLARGCAVGGIDKDGSVETAFYNPAWLGLTVDVRPDRPDSRPRRSGRTIRRARHRHHRGWDLRGRRCDQPARPDRLSSRPGGKPRLRSQPPPRNPPVAGPVSNRRPGLDNRLEERRGTGSRRRCLLGLEGRSGTGSPNRSAGMGRRRYTSQHRPPRRCLRHGTVE